MAAVKVIMPDGTKGISLSEIIAIKASLPSACNSFATAGYLFVLLSTFFLNPALYNKKAINAPIASPVTEINVPFQKPKNKILAAVRKTLGKTPKTAINILKPMLNKNAYWGYELKRSMTCCFTYKTKLNK
jgi:hypothetical protein